MTAQEAQNAGGVILMLLMAIMGLVAALAYRWGYSDGVRDRDSAWRIWVARDEDDQEPPPDAPGEYGEGSH